MDHNVGLTKVPKKGVNQSLLILTSKTMWNTRRKLETLYILIFINAWHTYPIGKNWIAIKKNER